MGLALCLILPLWAVVDTVTPEIDRYAVVVTWALQVSLGTLHFVTRPRRTVRACSEESIFVKVNQGRGKLGEVHLPLCRVLTLQFILASWAVGVLIAHT